MPNKTSQKQRAQSKQSKPSTTFKKKVMSVVTKAAEKKRFTTELNGAVTHSSMTTYNLTNGLVKGTNSAQRIGAEVSLKTLRLSASCYNKSSLGTIINQGMRWRVIVFRGKYDYNLTNYPTSEVFEANAGSAPINIITSPIDLNQVTLLHDQTFTLVNPYSGVELPRVFTKYIKINKKFRFKDDDEYGKTSNLYIGFCQENGATQNAVFNGHVTLSFTDL